jgi:hypothetical protein
VPDFLRFDRAEMGVLLQLARYPLASHVYMLLAAHSDFTSGEFLGSYARLISLCTVPATGMPGKTPKEPSIKQMRYALDLLEHRHMISRNKLANAMQGQLRIKMNLRKTAKEKALAKISHLKTETKKAT